MESIRRLSMGTLSLYSAISLRDIPTATHSLGVAHYCEQMALRLGLESPIEYFVGGLLHDLGKVSMSDGILKTNKRLDLEERRSLVKHVLDGSRVLKDLGYSDLIVEVAKYHHERMDGKGYLGVDGKLIPIHARIASIADSFDAINKGRLYQPAIENPMEALNKLHRSKGQFDVYLLRMFSNMVVHQSNSEVCEG